MNAKQSLRQHLESPESKVVGNNIDTEYGFMQPGRNLYVEGAEDSELRGRMGEVVNTLRENGYRVVHTADLHTPEDDEIIMPYQDEESDGVKTFDPHCMADEYAEVAGVESGGTEFIEETRPENPVYFDWREEDVDGQMRQVAADGGIEPVMYKNMFNVFEGTPHMDPLVDELDYDATINVGLTSGVCVHENTMGHAERGIDVYVVEDAIQRMNDDLADPARQKWEENPNVHMIQSQDVIDLLGG